MDLSDGIAYFLSGSDHPGSRGRKKSMKQLLSEKLAFSNGSCNYSLRKHLETINCYDCSKQLMIIQTLIENAEQTARFYGGSFVMEEDVKEKYSQLLEEHKRQTAEREEHERRIAEREEHKRQIAEMEGEKERLEERVSSDKKQERSEQEYLEQEHLQQIQCQCVHILLDSGFTDVKVDLKKHMPVEISGRLNEFEYKLQFKPVLAQPMIEDERVLTLAESLREIDLTDRKNRKSQIYDFYSGHGCNVCEVIGASGNNITVNLYGISAGLGSINYYFDLYEYERQILKKQPQISREELICRCSRELSRSNFSDFEFFIAEDHKSIEFTACRNNIRYRYQCKFYSCNNIHLYDFTDNVAQDVVLNCISALKRIAFFQGRGAVGALRKFFEDNHYSYINVFFMDNRFHVFATKYKTKFGMQYWCESLLQTPDVKKDS